MPDPANPDVADLDLTLTDEDLECYGKVGRQEEVAADDPSLQRLIALGVVIPNAWLPGRHVLADLRSAEIQLRKTAEGSAVAALARMGRIPALIHRLEREQPRHNPETRIEFLPGVDIPNDAISRATNGARHEQLSAQPSLRRPEVLDRAFKRDSKTLQRGVRMRILYPVSSRSNTHLHEYVGKVTALGAEVRTTEETFSRIVIIDQEHVFFEEGGVPRDPSLGAWHVRHPGVIGYLIEQYRLLWERAHPWYGTELSSETAISTPFQRSILWELVNGLDQQQIAKRLLVSSKTVNTALNDLRKKLGLKTPYQVVAWWMASEERRLEAPRAARLRQDPVNE
ncbi:MULTISPECIES: LuxR C-terminal-related transcriptional regulator [unclassified Streptomyces]|uniref:LuxR C-terminal-related transcriptional regulator n=1 Tax=unclassified Streptomyces TaxID=2593676 RepID=UPI00081E86C5|nr:MULTISPECIES: LuxR C-terminal-related transcriptional regulator [unclassified Streptomyces]MYZ37355.1 hypothetical protein [Streptomyces sp. SID4917]SCF90715.1 regulatory protein, luxR family [Streptomyces sp. MnatMP-M17]